MLGVVVAYCVYSVWVVDRSVDLDGSRGLGWVRVVRSSVVIGWLLKAWVACGIADVWVGCGIAKVWVGCGTANSVWVGCGIGKVWVGCGIAKVWVGCGIGKVWVGCGTAKVWVGCGSSYGLVWVWYI